MAAGPFRRYTRDVGSAFGRAPVEVALAFVLAAAFSWALEIDTDQAYQRFWEIFVVVVLAGASAWTGTLLHALGDWSVRRRRVVTAAGGLLAALYAVTFLDLEFEAERWRAATLVAAAALGAFSAPALTRRGAEARTAFRRVGGRLALRVAGGALYSAALFAGLALALAAIDSLFELDMDEVIYAHVWGWIAFALGPWIVAGGLEEIARPLEEATETMAVVHRVSAWLVLPLLAVYYGILYAYGTRIAILGELPQNLVSPLVVAAGVLAAVGLTLFDRGAEGGRPARALRITPLLFLPLAALGIYAVSLRVDQYGWTEFRYLRLAVLVAMVLCAVGAVVEALRRRDLSVHLAPLVAAGVLVVSAVGPWSATAVSRRSQHARLAAALSEAGLAQDGRVTVDPAAPPRELPGDRYERVVSPARYLARHFGPDEVSPPLEQGWAEAEAGADPGRALGLVRLDPEGGAPPRHALLPSGATIGEGMRLVRVRRRPGREGFTGAFQRDSTTLVVPLGTGEGRATVELGELVTWLRRQPGGPTVDLPSERGTVPLVDEEGAEVGTLVILELRLSRAPQEPGPIQVLDAVAILR